ncbi:helix-turn-helix domain-containing protein [Microbacterium sp. 18062]|uniref:helix-turn-helix domain-containing protein n=1 Tax=Microbacterium sp. 18062 TaxID=2681410 RepID=UPI00135BF252|nr:helix-turn-helix domain-containing protein [Microbacterium sp. 18062]
MFDRPRPARLSQRPGWNQLLGAAETGAVVVVDRPEVNFGSLHNVVDAVVAITERGLHLRSISIPALDTTSSGVRLSDVFALLHQLRSASMCESTTVGIAQSRASGTPVGRPPIGAEKRAQVLTLADQGISARHSATIVGVGRSTVSRILAREAAQYEK